MHLLRPAPQSKGLVLEESDGFGTGEAKRDRLGGSNNENHFFLILFSPSNLKFNVSTKLHFYLTYILTFIKIHIISKVTLCKQVSGFLKTL